MSRWALAHPYLTAFVVVPALVSGAVEFVQALRGRESPAEKLRRELEETLKKGPAS